MAFVKTASELKRLQKKFVTDERIGENFGISRQAVHQMRKKLDVPSVNNKNKLRNRNIVYMYFTMEEKVDKIANKHNLSTSQVYRILDKYYY